MPGPEDSLLFHPLEDEAQNQGPVIGQRAGWVHPHRCSTETLYIEPRGSKWGKWGRLARGQKLSKMNKFGDLMYSVVTIINNTVCALEVC